MTNPPNDMKCCYGHCRGNPGCYRGFDKSPPPKADTSGVERAVADGWTLRQVIKGTRDAAAFCDCSNHPDASEWGSACRLAAQLLLETAAPAPQGGVTQEPSEEAVEAAAKVMSAAPTIEPALPPECWHGTAREILVAALPHLALSQASPAREGWSPEMAKHLLAIRDALVLENSVDAYFHLMMIVDPTGEIAFNNGSNHWIELERAAPSPPPESAQEKERRDDNWRGDPVPASQTSQERVAK